MKTLFAKLAVTVISLVALAALVTLSTGIARKAERYQSAAVTQNQPGPEIIGNSYGEMMNNLFYISGR